MLDRQRVLAALEGKRRQFQEFLAGEQRNRRTLGNWLDNLERYDSQAILAWVAETGVAWPGALPTPEFDDARALCVPFGGQWSNHQDARAWALDVLRRRPTVAVDGSQITPALEYSVPVGAIQIGWFVNTHREGGHYVKDLEFEVLTPAELVDDGEDEAGFATQTVNQVRFVRECTKLCELMASFAAAAEADKPLCFFDGSFIISFAGKIRVERAQRYVQAVAELLAASTRYRVPLVGFVDSSLSHDIVTLLSILAGESLGASASDAGLLAPQLVHWGDRSPFFYCAREDALSQDGRAPFYRDVAFTYVRLSQDRPPARLELPRWIVEAGRAEEIVDLVRAECIVGTGYPYAIETADALAVIGQQDRQHFYALFEQFVAAEGMTFSQTRKARSKRARR